MYLNLENDPETEWVKYFDRNSYKNEDYITWCKRSSQRTQSQTALTAAMHGNEPTITYCYQTAAILISVPTWGDRNCSPEAPPSSKREKS